MFFIPIAAVLVLATFAVLHEDNTAPEAPLPIVVSEEAPSWCRDRPRFGMSAADKAICYKPR